MRIPRAERLDDFAPGATAEVRGNKVSILGLLNSDGARTEVFKLPSLLILSEIVTNFRKTK